MDTCHLLDTIANCVMALGALLIFFQIRQSKMQAMAQFEDSLTGQYRQIIHGIPVNILFGTGLSDSEAGESLDDFLKYFDLCNEQAFLRQQKKIRRNTWRFWADGMKSNFSRPPFRQAWAVIKAKAPSDFSELRRLEQTDFLEDPATWK